MANELFAPPEYWKLTPEEKKVICNGMGPKGYGLLVPDTMYGLDVSEAGNIHDFMYLIGHTIEDKEAADRTFLNNMLRIIEAKSKLWILKYIRRRRALTYYIAVKDFGGPAFWSGKNKPEEMGKAK